MRIKIDGQSEQDTMLLEERNRCTDSYECSLIAEQAESDLLRMEANRKCIRIYRREEYQAER